jgi:hypothetical protein
MNVIFEELPHEYYVTTSDGSKLYGLSMTTFIARFKQPFLDKFWKIYKAVQYELQIERREDFSAFCKTKGFYYNDYNKIKDEELRILFFRQKMGNIVDWNKILSKTVSIIKQEWDTKKNNACEVGTEFHEYKEGQAYSTGTEKLGNRLVDMAKDELQMSSKAIKYSKDLSKLEDGYHAELLLYTDSFIIDGQVYPVFLVGQTDKCFIETIGGVRYVDIDDYKTNKEIKFENTFQKMQEPLGHLDDCSYNHYSLQAVGYAEILRQHGYTPRHLYFTHHDIKALGMTKTLNKDLIGLEKVNAIPVKDLSDEFNAMITHSFPISLSNLNKKNYIPKSEKKAKTFLDYD